MSWSCSCESQTLHGDPPRPIVDSDGFRHSRDRCETLTDLRAEIERLRGLLARDLAGACACCVEYECDCLEEVRATLEESK